MRWQRGLIVFEADPAQTVHRYEMRQRPAFRIFDHRQPTQVRGQQLVQRVGRAGSRFRIQMKTQVPRLQLFQRRAAVLAQPRAQHAAHVGIARQLRIIFRRHDRQIDDRQRRQGGVETGPEPADRTAAAFDRHRRRHAAAAFDDRRAVGLHLDLGDHHRRQRRFEMRIQVAQQRVGQIGLVHFHLVAQPPGQVRERLHQQFHLRVGGPAAMDPQQRRLLGIVVREFAGFLAQRRQLLLVEILESVGGGLHAGFCLPHSVRRGDADVARLRFVGKYGVDQQRIRTERIFAALDADLDRCQSRFMTRDGVAQLLRVGLDL